MAHSTGELVLFHEEALGDMLSLTYCWKSEKTTAVTREYYIDSSQVNSSEVCWDY